MGGNNFLCRFVLVLSYDIFSNEVYARELTQQVCDCGVVTDLVFRPGSPQTPFLWTVSSVNPGVEASFEKRFQEGVRSMMMLNQPRASRLRRIGFLEMNEGTTTAVLSDTLLKDIHRVTTSRKCEAATVEKTFWPPVHRVNSLRLEVSDVSAEIFFDSMKRIASFLRMEDLGLQAFDLQVFDFVESNLDQFIECGSLKGLRTQPSIYNPLRGLPAKCHGRGSFVGRYFNSAGVITSAIRKSPSLRQVRLRSVGEFFKSVPSFFLAELAAGPPSHLTYLEIMAVDALCGFRTSPRNPDRVQSSTSEISDLGDSGGNCNNGNAAKSQCRWCPERNRVFLQTFYDAEGYVRKSVREEFDENLKRIQRGGDHVDNELVKESESEESKVVVSRSVRNELLREVLSSGRCTNAEDQESEIPEGVRTENVPNSKTQLVLNFSGRDMSCPFVVKLAAQDVARSLSILQAVECLIQKQALNALIFSNQFLDAEVSQYLGRLCSKNSRGLRHLELQNILYYDENKEISKKKFVGKLIDAGFLVGKTNLSMTTLMLRKNFGLLRGRGNAARFAEHIGQNPIERLCLDQCAVSDGEITSFAEALVSQARAKSKLVGKL